MTVIAELDEIINLLEATIPANPNSSANQGKAKSLERELAKYFGKIEQAFPYSKLESIYNRYVEKEVDAIK